MSGFRALVLAGARNGVDPVAAYAGVSHKGLASPARPRVGVAAAAVRTSHGLAAVDVGRLPIWTRFAPSPLLNNCLFRGMAV